MASNSYQRHGTKSYAGRSQRVATDIFSRNQERDYDMYEINVKPGDETSRSTIGGIEVTTEMTQESTKHGETTSERRLVLDPA